MPKARLQATNCAVRLGFPERMVLLPVTIVPMKPAFWLLPFFVCAALSGANAAAQSGPLVTVTGGRIRGRSTPDGGAAFKGIPYARPPLGELRWRAPQPAAVWTGVRDAAAFSVACTQLSEGWNI